MNAAIIAYLHEQQLASVCCVDAGGFPYCFNCYFAYDEPNQRLYFKSAAASSHA